MMRVLRELRWKYPASREASLILLNLYWLQFLMVQMPQESARFGFLLFLHRFLRVFSALQAQSIFLMLHLLIVIVLALWGVKNNFESKWLAGVVTPLLPIVAYTIKAYPFLLQIVVMDLSLSSIINHTHIYEVVVGIINIAMAIALTLGCSFINLTMQFVEIDYLAMRRFELSSSLLQIGIILGNCVLADSPNLVLCILNICLGLLMVFQQFRKCEYQLVRHVSLFYSILISTVSIGLVVYNLTNVPLNHQKLLFLIVMSAVVAALLSSRLNEFIKYRLPNRLVKSVQYQRLIRQYQLARQDLTRKDGPLSYLFYNIIVQHYSKCTKADCRCKRRHLATDLQPQHEEQVFVLQNLRIMGEALSTISNISEIRLLQIYFFLEIAKEPIKAYYEIIRLKRQKITFKTKTELESMIEMAKLCFAQIFKKNNVQNQQLELMKLIAYEENIERLEGNILDAVNRNIQFLKLFTYHNVKISDVEDQTSQIEEAKREIEQLLDQLALVNCESKSLNLFNFIFYRYVQFYRSRRVEFEKLKSQEQIKKRLFEKSEVDVFSSQHGTIYIDLIEERGKIMKITRNVCDLFGYPKNEMVEMNIDGYMPSIFARCHDRFLCNFIEKGQITLLKEKQRIIFGKNKKHFIFPFNIRLKVENTNEGAFGACALITRLSNNKEYILFGKKGCIDEMSEGIYKRIFQPLLQGDVSRASRLNLMKLMPALNLCVDLNQQTTQLTEGMVIFPQELNELVKFRYHRRIENETTPDNASMDKFDRMSFNTTNQMSLDSRRPDGIKTDTRYLQSFKSLLSQVDILQLRGYRIVYKLSEIVTNYFEAKIMEVDSIKEVPIDKKFYMAIIQEFRNVAAFFEINDEFSPWINKLNTLEKVIGHFSLAHILRVQNGPNLVTEYEQYVSNNQSPEQSDNESSQGAQKRETSDLEEANHDAESIEEINSESQNHVAEAGAVIRANSDQSSVIGNEQQENKKQLIIDAFSKDRSHGIPLSMVVFGTVAFILILLTMAGMFTASYMITVEERNEWKGGYFLVRVSQTIVYHTAFLQIARYYQLNSQLNQSQQLQQWIADENTRFSGLYSSITQQLLEVDFDRRSQSLSRQLQLYDPRVSKQVSFNFFNLMHLLNTLMMGISTRFDMIERNQLTIQQALDQLVVQDMQYRSDRAKQLRLICLVLFIVLEALLILTAIVSIPIYNYFRQRRMFLLRLLGYFNARDIRKSMATMKFLQECMTTANEGDRADRILNQLQAKKVHNTTIRDFQAEKEDQKGKAIKLSFQGLKDTKNQFVCMILLTILLLSAYPTALFGYNYLQQNGIEKTTAYETKLYAFENYIPVLLGTSFANINRNLQQTASLPLQYNLDKAKFFELVNFLANQTWVDPSKKLLLENLLKKDICATLQQGQQCSTLYGGILTKGYFYSMLMFRDKLEYLLLSDPSLQPVHIGQWATENNMMQFLQLLSYLRSATLLAGNLLRDDSLGFFNLYQTTLVYVAAFLAVFSLCCIWALKQWFVTRLMEIIKGAEKIYLNFNINILTQNTYLTSYFNSKVRVKI